MSARPILFDLDGVLARFTDAALNIHGLPPRQPDNWNFHHAAGLTDEAFYKPMGADFWAGLGRWEDGFVVLEAVIRYAGRDRIAFLTSPCQTAGCEEGKRRWAIEHLKPLGFDPWADVFMGGAKHKLAPGGAVLVEDSESNRDKWIAAGGQGWLVPRPWNKSAYLCGPSGCFDAESEAHELIRWLGGLS